MDEILTRIKESGVIAIMRAESPEALIPAAEAMREGGLEALEVSLTTPGALEVVTQVKSHFGGDIVFGAGTVLDGETAREAISAGAEFIVSPTFDAATVDLCKRSGVVVIPGGFTAREVLAAWRAGADIVKLFPASLGGPHYLKALRAPLPEVDLMPVGGVNEENLAGYLQAGAVAVGVGSSLVDQDLLERGDFDELEARARRLCKSVSKGRT